MGKNCSFLEILRCQIVVLHKEGHAERLTGERLECSQTAVHQAIVKVKELGTFADAKQIGRPRKTTPRTDILIKRKVMNSPRCSQEHLTRFE